MASKEFNSSVIDMEIVSGDESDYDTNFTGLSNPESAAIDPSMDDDSGPQQQKGNAGFMENVQQQMGQNVASYVWQSGSQKAKQAFNVYANIDILRPYFDVEPHEVRARLLRSFVPQRPGAQREKLPRELYGPTMIVFTLVAMLLFQMKSSGHSVQEGTLMGSAIGVCFGYWLGISSVVGFLAYVCNTHVTMLQTMSLLGYALFSHCLVVFLGTVVHTSHDHLFFYFLWGTVAGLSTLRMVSILHSRTSGQTQKLIVCGATAAFHMLFLLYLHFAYHQIVEEISDAFDRPAQMVPNQQGPMSILEQKQEALPTHPQLPNIDALAPDKMHNQQQDHPVNSLTTKSVQRLLRKSLRGREHEIPAAGRNSSSLLGGKAGNTSKVIAKPLDETGVVNAGQKVVVPPIKTVNGTKV